MATEPQQTELPPDLKLVADFLISSESALNLRDGTIEGQRAQYFKGKHAENALLRDTYQKKHAKTVPLNSREECDKYLQELLKLGLILKVVKGEGSKKLSISSDRIYHADNIYIFIYQGSQLMGRLMGTCIYRKRCYCEGCIIIEYISTLLRQTSYFI